MSNLKKDFISELKKLYASLSGKKTYIIAAICAALTFARIVGWISSSELETLIALFGSLGLVTIRDAIKKLE